MEYELKALVQRIEHLIEKRGTNASAVSKAAGKPDAIRNMQRAVADGKNYAVSVETLIAIANSLKSNAQWIIFGTGDEDSTDVSSTAVGPLPTKMARIVGVTQAGAWFEFEDFEHDAFDGAEIPIVLGKWANLEQFSYLVRGNSMNADGIPDGSYVICVRYFDARSDLRDGDRVVVERKRNSSVERSVKQIEITKNAVRFCPRSTDPRFQPIEQKIDRSDRREGDDTEVRVVGLVVGTWRPF